MSIDHVQFFSQLHNQDQIELIVHIDQVIHVYKSICQYDYLIMIEVFVLIFHIYQKYLEFEK